MFARIIITLRFFLLLPELLQQELPQPRALLQGLQPQQQELLLRVLPPLVQLLQQEPLQQQESPLQELLQLLELLLLQQLPQQEQLLRQRVPQLLALALVLLSFHRLKSKLGEYWLTISSGGSSNGSGSRSSGSNSSKELGDVLAFEGLGEETGPVRLNFVSGSFDDFSDFLFLSVKTNVLTVIS